MGQGPYVSPFTCTAIYSSIYTLYTVYTHVFHKYHKKIFSIYTLPSYPGSGFFKVEPKILL